ncbi:hypothetical protein DUNSADRAFT_8268 [Dunaliella salina]|uniref:Uncharacterized protein n=1 Tax=Dunaliella salina TaxID=3046 RepID=A0ABQ7HA74_DUNSA|nr:hypothetical protein DUNSADRAFT_8268 [Dunaliella salina]|eukprot:KAF5843753.1 hypothetical protein DUNSADRAFT_8268 [Dunaliella salina]
MKVAVLKMSRASEAHGETENWYRDVRKSKAADQAEARAMYHTRLLKEGCVQWLRVGMWRHQHRLQSLAERQAAAMAADLVRVAPYAALWRRVVAARSAARRQATRARGSILSTLPTTTFTTDAPAAAAASMRTNPSAIRASDLRAETSHGLGGVLWRGGMPQHFIGAATPRVNATFPPQTGTNAPQGFNWESALASVLPPPQPAQGPNGVSASLHGLPSHISGKDCGQTTQGTQGGTAVSSDQIQRPHGEPQVGMPRAEPAPQGNLMHSSPNPMQSSLVSLAHSSPSPEQNSPVLLAQPSSSPTHPHPAASSSLSLPSSTPSFLASSLYRIPFAAATTSSQPGTARAAAHALLEAEDRRRLAERQQRQAQQMRQQQQQQQPLLQQQQQQQQQSLPGASLAEPTSVATTPEHQQLGQGLNLDGGPPVGEGQLWHELQQMRAHALEQQRQQQQQQQQQQQNRLFNPLQSPSCIPYEHSMQGVGISSLGNPAIPSLHGSRTPLAVTGQLPGDGRLPAPFVPKHRPPPRMPEFLRRKHAD